MPTRRQYLLGASVAIAGAGTTHTALGTQQNQLQLAFGEINAEGEYLVLHNEGETAADIEGYVMDWEHANEDDTQTDELTQDAGETTIPAGGSITVATGARPVSDADVDFGHESSDEVMRNEEPDVFAVLTPDGDVVARSDEDQVSDAETPSPTEESTPTETETTEDTPTEEDGEDEDGDDEDAPPVMEAEQLVATLSGEGHGIDTEATGRAEFEVDVDAGEVHYTVEVSELCNATMAHIHLGGPGEDGPIVVWLYPEDQQGPRTQEGEFTGTLAEGTFTEADLVGPLEGMSLEDLGQAHADQGAYVNVHTEEHPGGEIRGQIEPAE